MEKQNGQNKKPGFWISVFLRVCLAGGLGVFIISTYAARSASGTVHIVSPSGTSQPALSLQGPQRAPIEQGEILILHGEHFGVGDTISFLLDSTTPIMDEHSKIISVRTSNSGGFDVRIPVRQGLGWSAAPHYIQALDHRSEQNAYLHLVVSSASIPEATSKNMALSLQGKPVKKLIFHAVVGQGNPDQQRVTLTNTSGLELPWTATAIADHNLTWLVIDDNHTAGNLNFSGTDSIGISVLIAGLKSNAAAHPYTGQIVFTLNGQGQLTLPVELQVADPQSEMVFNPNPVTATLSGNTCKSTELTLLNLGKSFINWKLVPYDPNVRDHIQFLAEGRPIVQGLLAASGTSGDTQVLNVHCQGVSAGDMYKFTLYANDASSPVTIFIRTSS
jgi:hypothetical protein